MQKVFFLKFYCNITSRDIVGRISYKTLLCDIWVYSFNYEDKILSVSLSLANLAYLAFIPKNNFTTAKKTSADAKATPAFD